MKKSLIYTKGGDKGETSLVSGTRILKSAEVINLYGNLDELNSHFGYLISLCETEDFYTPEFATFFQKVQSTFFDLGSKLACESEYWEKYKLPNIDPTLVGDMEKLIDQLDSELPKLKTFILPGGALAASYGHIVRTKCRSVERDLVHYKDSGFKIPEGSLELLNRFSDFVFVFSRYINLKSKRDEILWHPGSN